MTCYTFHTMRALMGNLAETEELSSEFEKVLHEIKQGVHVDNQTAGLFERIEQLVKHGRAEGNIGEYSEAITGCWDQIDSYYAEQVK